MISLWKFNQSHAIVLFLHALKIDIMHAPSCDIYFMYLYLICQCTVYNLYAFDYLCMGSYASVSSFNPWEFEPSDLNAESSTKLIHAITWKSISSRQPSCKSLTVPNVKNSSTWVEYKNDLFDDYGGMDSGSHLLTLGRLYAWEKKLFEEVKVGYFYLISFYFNSCNGTCSTFILKWIKITEPYTIAYFFTPCIYLHINSRGIYLTCSIVWHHP